MRKELGLEFARVAEAAALAAHKHVGKGDKIVADQAAVDAMRTMFNRINIDGEIVIGEGEIDEAPMLYIGEKVGVKYSEETNLEQDVMMSTPVDIAVDPVEGTRMTAQGQPNAITVLAAGNKGSFLKAPDMYMEKLVVGPDAKGVIDLDKPLMENLELISKKLGKSYEEMTIVVLDKPRHSEIIKELHVMGMRVYALPDGDVAGSILTSVMDSDADVMYGVGGAPEGVISAAVIKALGGDMNAKLVLRSDVKGSTPENDKISAIEKDRCDKLGIDLNKVLTMDDMVKDDEVIFAATGITDGDLLKGIKRKGNIAKSETLLVRGKTKTIRYITSVHNLDYKDEKIMKLVK